MGLEIGDVIDDKYRIVSLLGEGGMGAVYEGENVRIRRRVAIKILHAAVATSSDAVQRFEREAQAAGRIGSEHIVEVLDLGELPGGDRYMVMEFLDGESLNDRIAHASRISPQATARIVVDVLEGLKAAHRADIIHRDLKPDNIFLLANKSGKKDFVKIVDFGISKFSSLGGEFSMTRTGAVMGTPYYLSPEQAKGDRNLDARADLYAVGVILYQAVAGRVPFDGESFNELLFKIVLEPMPPLSLHVPDVDPHFAALVEKSMARDPALRFQTAEEMQQALGQWLEGQPAAPELLASAAAATAERAPRDHSSTGSSHQGSHTGGVHTDGVQAGTGNRTHGAWTNTQTILGGQSNKKKLALVGAAAAAALVVGGALAWSAKQNDEADTQAAAQQAADEEREEELQRKADLARLEAEKARAEAERAQAARAEAEKAKAEAQKAAATEARKNAEKEASKAAQPAPTPRVQAPKRSPAPAPVGGRRIRTDL